VDLRGALPEEEQAAGDQNHVSPRDSLVKDAEQRLGEPHEPGERRQEPDAHHHGKQQPEPPDGLSPRRRQLVGEDRDEDDVVDAEHQLERDQRQECEPGLRIAQKLHG